MKELTIEQKAKAYDEALKVAKKLIDAGLVYEDAAIQIFPELKEGEDEKIRKELIRAFKSLNTIKVWNGIERTDILAWLEKRGEQKEYTFKSIPRLLNMIEPTDRAKAYCQKLIDTLAKEGYNTDTKIVEEVLNRWNGENIPMVVMDEQKPTDKIEPKFKVGDCIERKDGLGCHAKIIFVGGNVYGCEKIIYSEDSFPFFELMFENQDEFLLSSDFGKKSVDKIVESKFKVGDWIIYSNEEVHLITGFDANGYFVDKECYIPFNCEGNMRLWTIQDAKDGDVLRIRNLTFIFQEITNNNVCHKDAVVAYCSYEDNNDGFGVCGPDCITDLEIIIPATKEQRDLLFQKMKEASYEWDAENKELKKIEQKHACSDDKKLTDVNHEYFNELLENNNSKDINNYAYQVAHCMSHDWANETPTWDDVQKACKLGAEWKEKHHKSKWNEQENKDKLKSLLFNAKSITYESFKNEDDPLVAIYFNNLIEIIDKL